MAQQCTMDSLANKHWSWAYHWQNFVECMMLFGAPKILFGLRNILLKLFDSSYGFGATDGKIVIFWHNLPWKSQNCGSDTKVLEVFWWWDLTNQLPSKTIKQIHCQINDHPRLLNKPTVHWCASIQQKMRWTTWLWDIANSSSGDEIWQISCFPAAVCSGSGSVHLNYRNQRHTLAEQCFR